MTSPLGTDLGRLAAPPTLAPFDGIRLAMVDDLISGRRVEGAGHAPWQAAWDAAATRMRDVVMDDARAALLAAGKQSRYPTRRLAALQPDDETADVLRNRLLAEGIPLEQFEGAPVDPETDRRRAAALEQAWVGLVRVASTDRARWRDIASQVAAWRRSMRSFWLVATVMLVLVSITAAWLGGQLPAPAWFQAAHDWWWSLPWP